MRKDHGFRGLARHVWGLLHDGFLSRAKRGPSGLEGSIEVGVALGHPGRGVAGDVADCGRRGPQTDRTTDRRRNFSFLLPIGQRDALVSLTSGAYASNSMRLRTWVTPFMVLLAAALPTLVSLCELRCVSPGAASTVSQEAESPACSGHRTEGADKAPAGSPSESRHDCGGHALLAKSGSVAFEFQLGRAFVGLCVVTTASGLVNDASGHSASLSVSTDLSPPFGRRPGVLRL